LGQEGWGQTFSTTEKGEGACTTRWDTFLLGGTIEEKLKERRRGRGDRRGGERRSYHEGKIIAHFVMGLKEKCARERKTT